jgi:predicted nucleic acid-binding protein
MSPIVLAELLSDPIIDPLTEELILKYPLIQIGAGFWYRAAKLRSSFLMREYKPKLADTLIAQLCLDWDISLLTRDRHFDMFVRHAHLRVL